MPSYIPTGRTRTISASGTFSLDPGTYTLTITNNHAISADGAFSFSLVTNPVTGLTLPVFSCGFHAQADAISGVVHVTSIRVGGLGYGAGSNALSITVAGPKTGTFSFSCDMEEVSLYSYTGRAGSWQLYERPKAGGTITGTITFAGTTYSFTHTLTASDSNILNNYTATLLSDIDPGTQVLSGTPTSATTATVLGQAINYAYSKTYSGSGYSTVVDFTSGSSVAISLSGGNYGSGMGAQIARDVTRQVTVQGQINAFDIAYPSALITEWVNPEIVSPTPTTFSLGDTISIENYLIQSYGYDTDEGLRLKETLFNRADGRGIQCRINAASLAAANENAPNAWDVALNARLKPFNALTIWQDASTTVDPANSTSGWSANVSVSGGHLVVDSSSLSGLAKRTFSPAFASEGYRYLEVDINPASTSSGTLILKLTDSSAQGIPYAWNYKGTMGAAGSTTTVRFDLLAPYTNDYYAGASAYTSKILDSKQATDLTPASGPGWGIDLINYLSLQFPVSSGNYTISAIRLVRDSAPRLTFLQSSNYGYEWPTGTSNWYKFGLADTDGKRSLSIGDLMHTYPYTMRQLSAGVGTFSSAANAIAGWHVTPNVSSGDMAAWYFDWNLGNLCGAGCIYTGTAPSTFWFDQPLTTNPTQLQVQARAQSVIFPPQCGDITNAGGYGTAFVYYTWEFLRQRVTGVAIDKSQAPISGHTVTESEYVGGGFSGSGTTSSAGRFLTGANYAKTKLSQKSVLSGVTSATGTITNNAQARDILRLSYNSQPDGVGYAWHLQDKQRRVHEAVVISGDVWYRRSDFHVPAPSWLFQNQVTSYGDCTDARMQYEPATGILYMLIERFTAGAYNLYVTHSIDHGASWTTPTLYMANARAGTPFRTHMGGFGFCYFVYDSGTSGQGRMWLTVRNAGDTSWPAAWKAKDSGGSDILVQDMGWSNIDGEAWTWAPLIVGDSTPSFWFSLDQGKTWTRFT
jgi:hypothetical protein